MQHDDSIAAGRVARSDPIMTEHLLVRKQPVPSWKSLFFNPGIRHQDR